MYRTSSREPPDVHAKPPHRQPAPPGPAKGLEAPPAGGLRIDLVSAHTELLTTGRLARRTGLSVRTIRFWSDSGVVAPAGRSAGGYRLYDAEAVARLDLVRSLRELGFDLDTVRRVLARQVTVHDVARTQLRALNAEIRMLQVRRAVLQRVARHGSTTEEMGLMHELARMSADERQRITDDFVHETFDGVDPDAPGGHIAQTMRTMPAELPADPTPEQVDAWVELAELVGDEGFRNRVHEMAVAGAQAGQEPHGPAPTRRRSRSTPPGGARGHCYGVGRGQADPGPDRRRGPALGGTHSAAPAGSSPAPP
ncbi:MerR family transcriptional regulator [Streptomyces sp. ISL-86]|nr:MerR family transcriptional regulator [Streptomyces sp. ISL-86]